MASTSKDQRPTAFLDTSALAAYFDGKGAAAHLFDREILARTRYAVNPIVLQEILLLADEQRRTRLAELAEERLSILPIDPEKAIKVSERVRGLRNRIAHSNDVLVFASAEDCDYLITDDDLLAQLSGVRGPEVLTVDQFLDRLSVHA
jgi:predicted nucleic acid-binding protein